MCAAEVRMRRNTDYDRSAGVKMNRSDQLESSGIPTATRTFESVFGAMTATVPRPVTLF